MDSNFFSEEISLKNINITDSFWSDRMETVRKELIPYQWKALNDELKDAAPSYCMRNFKIAGKMNQSRHRLKGNFKEPEYTFRGFEMLPDDPENLENRFYGFVFQDSDFYKWIETVAYSLTAQPDPSLERLADKAIDIVCSAQTGDGYLDTYYIISGRDKIFSNLRDHHELYCLGHLIEGAVAYYQATGKDKLLICAEKYANYADRKIGLSEEKIPGIPGHELIEMALIRLYEITKKEKYLSFSRYFIDERGKKPYFFDIEHHEDTPLPAAGTELRYEYYQSHLPVREQKEAVGHAVRAVYLYSGMADLAKYQNEDSLFQTCQTLFENITKKKMYLTGGIGSTKVGEAFGKEYELPNDTAYAETCASVGMVFFAWRMLKISPDSRYADIIEREIYNGALAGMALDGKSFFYVNPLKVDPPACKTDADKSHVKPIRQKWFGCACCPPNIARLISSIGKYAFTENEDTTFLHLYLGGTISFRQAVLQINSLFPWEGKVEITVESIFDLFKGIKFQIALRIPGWCSEASVQYNGQAVTELPDCTTLQKNGYLYIKKEWHENDILTLDFPMEVNFVTPPPKATVNKGYTAVMRGPVVYCIEECDNGSNLDEIFIDKTQKLGKNTISDMEILGVTMKLLHLKGIRKTGDSVTEFPLTLIPYFAWANRGENEMQVWIKEFV